MFLRRDNAFVLNRETFDGEDLSEHDQSPVPAAKSDVMLE